MSKHVGLSAAIGLVGVGIILNALPKFGIGTPAAIAAPLAPVAQAGAPAPTIVWYGTEMHRASQTVQILWRGWSDGTIELKRVEIPLPGDGGCLPFVLPCSSPWFTVSSPNDGLSAAADTNGDQLVDGADLANLLAAWGPAPRSPIPPSDCPLNLVSP
jgi:hypothetical protein